MDTLKAVCILAYGDRDQLKYEDAPCPELADHDILIRVHATGVNPFDWYVRAGYLAGMINYSFPLIVGWDVSGVVETVGGGITNLAAWQSLFKYADLSEGQTVLVHAAAGAVGHFAVQFAKLHGARVIGTASADNLDFLRRLGAGEAIDS